MTGRPKSGASDPLRGLRAATAELAEARAEATELRGQLERQDAALAEFQHHARNTMALLRSAFRRTVETAESLEDVELHFSGRLAVLARYQVPRFGGAGDIELEDIIREELHAFLFGDSPGITIAGPPVRISTIRVQAMALAIHELVTNALKFGALAGTGRSLSVTWTATPQRVVLLWAETGVPMVSSAPVRSGFGREFIEEGMPYQVDAVTAFQSRPGGISWRIEFPLDAQG